MAYWIQRSFAPQFAIRARFVLKDVECDVSLDEATPVAPELVPKEAILQSSRKSLPNFFHLAGCWCVSELFRGLIEKRDPDIHQFFPIKLCTRSKVFDETSYFLFNILNRFDAILVSRSNVEWVDIDTGLPPYLKRLALAPGEPRLVMSKDVIGGRHVWRNDYLLSSYGFISDDLLAEFESSGLRQGEIRLTKVEEVEEPWDPRKNLGHYVDQVPTLRQRYGQG